MIVEKEFTILVLDRNRHVLMFLKRELERKGYRVFQEKDRCELSSLSLINNVFDLIVLDPELSDSRGIPILETVHFSFPGVPIILHTFWQDKAGYSCDPSVIAYVEKNGNSIVTIQQIISDMIRKKNDDQMATVDTPSDIAAKKDQRLS